MWILSVPCLTFRVFTTSYLFLEDLFNNFLISFSFLVPCCHLQQTNKQTPWCRFLFEKLIVTHLVKKFSNSSFFILRVHYHVYKSLSWSQSCARWIHSTPSHPVSLRSILILSTHLCLGLMSGLFPFRVSKQTIVCICHLPHECYIPHLYVTHLGLNTLIIITMMMMMMIIIIIIIICEVYKLWSSSLCSLLQPPTTSSLLGQNILLSTLFANTFNLCSSLSVRDHVSHPYRTTGKIVILYILMF